MHPILQEALAGEPVTVTLGGETYPLAYPIQGVILYKQETAKLDRSRSKDRTPLTREEKRELRNRRRKLLAEANELRPKEGEKWDDENFARFDDLLVEARSLKSMIDDDAAAGDSLYDKLNWWKISPEDDPERLLLALWVGLHQFSVPNEAPAAARIWPDAGRPKKEYREMLSRERLGELIDLANGEDLTRAIAKALRAHLIVSSDDSESAEKEPLPNAQPPATPAEETTTLPK
jgi:hypothetical protein